MGINKIELFLPNGDPTGCMICEAANWDGKIFRLPKKLINKYSARKELQYTGVYFLIGNNDDGVVVYIGEAENLHVRLLQHINKDYWNECIILTKKENALNKAHVKYLENLFYKLAQETKRCKLKNGSTPTQSSISEADEAVMTDFAEKATDVLSALGYRFFTPVLQGTWQNETRYEIKLPRHHELRAYGVNTNEGFVVMKGSHAVPKFKTAKSKSLIKEWNRIHDNGTIVDNVFADDYLTTSPSRAAAMVLGHNANGNLEWKDVNGKCLKEHLNNNQKNGKDS